MARIEIKNLNKVFRTELVETMALTNLSLTIEDGEFVAIMGPSGCGKSTLLNIMGLLDEPTSGEYLLCGVDVSKKTESDRTDIRKGVLGFVFQSFNLIEDLNVEENIELPLFYMGLPKAERRKRVEAAMDRVSISHRAQHFPSQLSGGQQQRVAIARAVVSKPSLILADEPTGNLDSKTSLDVIALLKSSSKRFEQTIVMITHNEEIALMADRMIRIEDGRIGEV